MAHLSRKAIKYISTVDFTINPVSASQATRSLRLILSTMPTKPPPGQNSFPQVLLSTTPADAQQRIEVTYADKKALVFAPDNLSAPELIRKMEEHAKALRAKEEGL